MAAGALLPSGYETLEDANGVTIPGGLIWTYAAGTTTPLATYTDSALTVPNQNPIIADGAGRWLAYAAPGTGFKFVFETPAIPPVHGATIKTCDNIVAPLTDSTAGATGGATVISDNTTGVVNNFILPGRTKDTLWVWNGSADLSITGIAGAAQGDRITIKNMSTVANRSIFLSHMSASSTNPLFNVITIGTTLIESSGWATFVLVGGTWVMTDHEQGAWYTRPFVATNFTATVGAWTVASAARDAMYVKGRTLHYAFNVTGTTSVATPGIGVIFPNGYFLTTGANAELLICYLAVPAVAIGMALGQAGTLAFNTTTGANIPAVGGVTIIGTFMGELR
jgi:hypothetical protein